MLSEVETVPRPDDEGNPNSDNPFDPAIHEVLVAAGYGYRRCESRRLDCLGSLRVRRSM